MRELFGRGRRRRERELAEIEAEITAFGVALDEHPFAPGQPDATDEMRADLERALDAYDEAKRAFVGDRDREDALDALRALDGGATRSRVWTRAWPAGRCPRGCRCASSTAVTGRPRPRSAGRPTTARC
ncbi:hypothetical protein J7E88_13655 [Streptomyces sp. ISL-10]|uniref:hypothetical protein n=1 Tax=Streptomyces sp. ISL-10 TaxID=2819172 RepID=UPI001BE802F1|nr:hypothetical protein [Streptomyces sp. ISL-10]MBT2366322.1 hypothetical protein [Streptomyces sp. ISL-10]